MSGSRKVGTPPGNQNAIHHGAPKGNTNALKHGFYSHSFTRPEKERLDRGYLGELNDEEQLLHATTVRFDDCAAHRTPRVSRRDTSHQS